MSLECLICNEYFDLNKKYPMALPDGAIMCNECAQRSKQTIDKIIKSPIDQKPYYIDDCMIDYNTESLIKKLSIDCLFHGKSTYTFNKTSGTPVCESCDKKDNLLLNSYEDSILNVLGILIKNYLLTKEKISKPSRMFIKDLMKSNNISAYYKAINFIKLHSRPLLICQSPNCSSDFYLDTNFFEITCRVCSKFSCKCSSCEPGPEKFDNKIQCIKNNFNLHLKTNEHLIEVFSPMFEEIKSSLKSKIWSSLFKNPGQCDITKIAEAIIIKEKKAIIKSNKIDCQDCRKLFLCRPRHPISLTCGHLKCFSCYTKTRFCSYCGVSQEVDCKVQEKIKEEDEKNCFSCKKEIEIFKDIPLHFVCDCLICNQCFYNGIRCNCYKEQDDIIETYPKIFKNKLIEMIYSAKAICSDLMCGRPAEYLDKQEFRYYCSSHKKIQSVCVQNFNFVEDRDVLENLRSWYKQQINTTEEISICMAEYIWKVLPDELKINLIENKGRASIEPYLTSYLQFYNNLFPERLMDKRVFSTELINNTYSVTIRCSESVELAGLILGGSAVRDNKEIRATIKVFREERFMYKKKIVSNTGGFYYCPMRLDYSRNFKIEIRYSRNYLLHSGCKFDFHEKPLQDNGIGFSLFNTDQPSVLFGPVIGIIYNYKLKFC